MISSVIYKVRQYDEKIYETDSWNVDSFFAYKFGLFIDMNIIYNRRHIAIRAYRRDLAWTDQLIEINV